jgi:hypothetical protein
MRFEAILSGEADPTRAIEDENPTDDDADFATRWLEPGDIELRTGAFDTVDAVPPTGETHRGVFAISCFPATEPDRFISLRVCDVEGQHYEIGIVRSLDRWSPESQQLIRAALARRYYIRRITRVNDIRLEYGYLNFNVVTDHGPETFTMRWSQSQAQDFGAHGKVLLDLEDNRYLVPDIAALPRRDRELMQRFIYW